MRALLLLVGMSLAGCVQDDAATEPIEAPATQPLPDVLAAGPLTALRTTFDLGQQVIMGSQGVYLVHVHGEMTMPDGDGPFPVALLMHGRHGTCNALGGELLLQPCPETPATRPVPSHQGYRLLADGLASHGIASLSIDANNVNDRDNDWGTAGDDHGATARANILHAVADALQDDEAFAAARDRLDLDAIGLMGHSRGGEGVIRAAVMQPDRYAAVFALAPTDFARWEMPDVPFATLLPYCDGDVFSLHGTWVYDDMDRGPKHQFLHMGANHNFYNNVWTNDDWAFRQGDPYCSPDADATGRLAAADQEAQGAAIMATFFRYYLGDGEALWPYLEGSAPWPFDVKVSADWAVGHSQVRQMDPDGTYPYPGGVSREGVLPTPCSGGDCPIPNTFGTARQFHLALDAGQNFSFVQPGVIATTFRSFDAMTVRIGLPPDTTPEALEGLSMFLEDADGKRFHWHLAEHGLFVPPGDVAAKTTLNMLWLPEDGIDTAIDRDHGKRWGFHAEAPIEFQFTDWYEIDRVGGGPRFAKYTH